jgi:hypothetical protein
MKISKITNWMVAGAACLLLGTSCDVDPTFYSQVVPDTYYTNADAIWSRFNRPFTHWRWWVAHNDARVRLMEVGTDAMCVPTRGNDWFDGAVYQNMHHHHFMDDMSPMKDGWDLISDQRQLRCLQTLLNLRRQLYGTDQWDASRCRNSLMEQRQLQKHLLTQML